MRINNLEELKFEVHKRGISIEDLVMQKARELGFEYDMTLPNLKTPRNVYGEVARQLRNILGEESA